MHGCDSATLVADRGIYLLQQLLMILVVYIRKCVLLLVDMASTNFALVLVMTSSHDLKAVYFLVFS